MMTNKCINCQYKFDKEELTETIRELYEGRNILSHFDNGFVEAITQVLDLVKAIPEAGKAFYPVREVKDA